MIPGVVAGFTSGAAIVANATYWVRSTSSPPVVRRVNGSVTPTGEFTGSSVASEEARFVGTVPAGYRPSQAVQVQVILLGTEQYEQAGSSATVTPDGRITLDIVSDYSPCTMRFNGGSWL